MRRALVFSCQKRSITGVSPMMFIPRVAPDLPHDKQVEKNTNIAVEVLKLQKGPIPAPYIRKHSTTIEQICAEIDELLGSAAKLRREIKDDEPLDKIGAMERALRHLLWSYFKDEGHKNFEEMERWLVYTPSDQQRLTDLRQRREKLEKYADYRKHHPSTTVPSFNLTEEYSNVVDREALVEKRMRYETIASTTMERSEAQIEKLTRAYRQPKQCQRLDRICELLKRFRPILAREAILQRLTVKHLEGKLGLWRYLDWNPEVRDRAELEADHYCQQWWYTNEEKRLSVIRLRSKNELAEIAEKNLAKALSEGNGVNSSSSASGASGDAVQAAREKLLQEIIRLQSRVTSKTAEEDDKNAAAAAGDDAAKLAAARELEEKRLQVKIPEEVLNERGLIGLDFILEKEKSPAKVNA